MIFHRFDGNRQLFRYLFVGIAFGYLQHKYVFPDGRKIFGNGMQVVGRFVVGVRETEKRGLFVEVVCQVVLVFTFNGLLAQVVYIYGTGNGKELGIQGVRYRQGMPGLPKLYKRLLSEVFGYVCCPGALQEIMKQFGVVPVVRRLKGQLVTFLYFRN